VRRRRPQARGQITREKLLEAAEWLFKSCGYDATSIGDIAGRAGVGVGTVYHHFTDKRAMLLQLVDRWGDRVAAQRRSELDVSAMFGADPRRAVHTWLTSGYERLRSKPSIYLMVLALSQRDEEVRRRYQRIEQLGIERLTVSLELGKQSGFIRQAIDAPAAAFLVHHAVDMAATQLLVRDPAGVDPDRVLSELADMICRYCLEDEK